jgi:hypothetical protein
MRVGAIGRARGSAIAASTWSSSIVIDRGGSPASGPAPAVRESATRAALRGLLMGMPPAELGAGVTARPHPEPDCRLVDLERALAETDNLLAGRGALARWRAGIFDDVQEALHG